MDILGSSKTLKNELFEKNKEKAKVQYSYKQFDIPELFSTSAAAK